MSSASDRALLREQAAALAQVQSDIAAMRTAVEALQARDAQRPLATSVDRWQTSGL